MRFWMFKADVQLSVADETPHLWLKDRGNPGKTYEELLSGKGEGEISSVEHTERVQTTVTMLAGKTNLMFQH